MKKKKLVSIILVMVFAVMILVGFAFMYKSYKPINANPSNDSNVNFEGAPEELSTSVSKNSDLIRNEVELNNGIEDKISRGGDASEAYTDNSYDLDLLTTNSIYLEGVGILNEKERHIQAQRMAAEKYKNLIGKPNVIVGKVNYPFDKKVPLTVLAEDDKENYIKAIVDEDMHFVFEANNPGLYKVELIETKANPGIRLENIVVKKGEVVPLVDINAEDGTIEVIVRDDSGKPLQGTKMTVGKAYGGQNPNLFTYRRGISDESGKFIASNLTSGIYVVAAEYGTETESSLFSLEPDQYLAADIEIYLSGKQIFGTIQDGKGRGLGGYLVTLQSIGTVPNQKQVFTNTNGEFAFNHVPPGEYIIMPESSETYVANSMSVSVTESNVLPNGVTFELCLRELVGSISGRIIADRSISVGNMSVVAYNQEGHPQCSSAVSPLDMSFNLVDCPAGKYSVVVFMVDPESRNGVTLGRDDDVEIKVTEHKTDLVLELVNES